MLVWHAVEEAVHTCVHQLLGEATVFDLYNTPDEINDDLTTTKAGCPVIKRAL